ncbi:MAG: LysR family transcriptional regulator [Betaproteobacteria bacterium]
MNPNSLRYFLEAARAGSFRRAGDKLHVAASAVNRQISMLEKNLGAPLFERSRGRSRLRLTAAGEVLVLHAKAVVDQLERARTDIDHLKGLRAGNVVLGVPETFSRDFLPEFLAQFHRSYPGISFRVVTAASPQLLEMLLKDEVEIALLYNPALGPQVQVHARIEQRIYVMVRADHPLAKKSGVHLSDLADYPLIVPDLGTAMRALHDRIAAKLRPRPKSILTSSSYEMLRSAARMGLGIAIVNDYLVAEDGRKDAAFVPIRDAAVRTSVLACCTRSERRLSVAASILLERIKEALATSPRRE